MKNLKYHENYQNVTQRHKASKCNWKNGTNRFAGCWVATNLQFQKNVIFVKCNKIKYNKMRCDCVTVAIKK